ncbi:hypothetical protein F5I97DRAFT_931619 [Phlebopus sp. FC_14]|nr:hypothetical protein F5I97DRAFT_931619 [Phlebopus sp. FC_14]
MPVPVHHSNSTTDSTHKRVKAGNLLKILSSVSHHPERSVSLSPACPLPPSGGRERCIHPLSPCTTTEVRQGWQVDFGPVAVTERQNQGFCKGLAGAIGASAIKGAHVETCIPPLEPLFQTRALETMSPVAHHMPGFDIPEFDTQNARPPCGPLSPTSPVVDMQQNRVDYPATDAHRCLRSSHLHAEDELSSFAPILEDDSPEWIGGDMGSSPIEPLTPFGDYVDRAVATSDPSLPYEPLAPRSQLYTFPFSAHCGSRCPPNCCHLQPYSRADVKEGNPTTASQPSAPATLTYRKLAEPMAEWIVSYVWKVCTNAISPPQTIARCTSPHAAQLQHSAPLHLASSVHSLLMSTLLQPSAILLALWYIVRLPVYFGAAGLGLEHVKERRFRAELFGDNRNNIDGETVEGTATFRLIVLGCMLANKWLDDHTFSNKTWHTISTVPVQSLNKLEYLALDILSHDLSISPSAWSLWLSHLHSYHQSLSAVKYPQPISRPSFNPHTVILNTIQDIMEAPHAYLSDEPVFLGEQRLKDKLRITGASGHCESFDIDLDEDGPLREEYLPRRHASNGISTRCANSEIHTARTVWEVASQRSRQLPYHHLDITIPSSVQWGPTSDEPVNRAPHRIGALYIPVQPSFAPQYVAPAPAMYHGWPADSAAYLPVRQHRDRSFAGNMLPVSQYHQWHQANGVQLQSYYDSNYFVSRDRVDSHRNVGYRCSDVRMTSDGTGHRTQTWTPLEHYGVVGPRQSLAATRH